MAIIKSIQRVWGKAIKFEACHRVFKVGYIRTSGKFGHTFANSGNPEKTAPYEPPLQDFHCLLS